MYKIPSNIADRIEIEGDCWLWVIGINSEGYGRYGGKPAHRVVYEMLKGKIPEGLQIDHLCMVRNCVNPEHLEPVTQRENVIRGKLARIKTCPRGHAHDAKRRTGGRVCNRCRREKYQERTGAKPRRIWRDEDKALLKNYWMSGMDTHEIAKNMNRTFNAISTTASLIGLMRRFDRYGNRLPNYLAAIAKIKEQP